MSNISITERCNLACPYCFANEFVNKSYREISEENFRIALEFLLTSRNENINVGIIGGEPTLHHEFSNFINILNHESRIKDITVFTNGIQLAPFLDSMDDKFGFLINMNHPNVVGKSNYEKTLNSIELIKEKNNLRGVTLGLNLYRPDQDFSYFLDVIDTYDFQSSRLSITVPNNIMSAKEAFERLGSFKSIAYEIYVELLSRRVRVQFDCNKIPMCLWTEKEKKKISLFQANEPRKQLGINLEEDLCHPVIDILPDLTAIRCFGLSYYHRLPISNFANIDDLRSYYRKTIDEPLGSIPGHDSCPDCGFFKTNKCYAGCLISRVSTK